MSNSLNLIDIYKINVFPSFSDDDYNIQLNEKKLNLENGNFNVFSNENFQFLPKEKFILQKKEINFQIVNKTKEQNNNNNKNNNKNNNENNKNNNENNKIFSLFIETPTLFDINRSYSKINQIKINSNNQKNFFSSSLIKPINLKPFSINATKKTNNNNNNFNTNNNNNFNTNNFNTNINNNNNINRNEINNLSNIEIKNKLLNSYNSNISNIKNNNNEEYFNTEPSLTSNNFIPNYKENNNLIINNNNNNINNYNKKHKNKLFQYLPKLRSKSQNKIDNNNNNNNKKIDIRSELLDLDIQYESVKKDLIEINP